MAVFPMGQRQQRQRWQQRQGPRRVLQSTRTSWFLVAVGSSLLGPQCCQADPSSSSVVASSPSTSDQTAGSAANEDNTVSGSPKANLTSTACAAEAASFCADVREGSAADQLLCLWKHRHAENFSIACKAEVARLKLLQDTINHSGGTSGDYTDADKTSSLNSSTSSSMTSAANSGALTSISSSSPYSTNSSSANLSTNSRLANLSSSSSSTSSSPEYQNGSSESSSNATAIAAAISPTAPESNGTTDVIGNHSHNDSSSNSTADDTGSTGSSTSENITTSHLRSNISINDPITTTTTIDTSASSNNTGSINSSISIDTSDISSLSGNSSDSNPSNGNHSNSSDISSISFNISDGNRSSGSNVTPAKTEGQDQQRVGPSSSESPSRSSTSSSGTKSTSSGTTASSSSGTTASSSSSSSMSTTSSTTTSTGASRQGCDKETQQYCSTASDRDLECLLEHKSELSASCQAEVSDRVAAAAALVDDALRGACTSEAGAYCPDDQTEETLQECLLRSDHKADFKPLCRVVVNRLEHRGSKEAIAMTPPEKINADPTLMEFVTACFESRKQANREEMIPLAIAFATFLTMVAVSCMGIAFLGLRVRVLVVWLLEQRHKAPADESPSEKERRVSEDSSSLHEDSWLMDKP